MKDPRVSMQQLPDRLTLMVHVALGAARRLLFSVTLLAIIAVVAGSPSALAFSGERQAPTDPPPLGTVVSWGHQVMPLVTQPASFVAIAAGRAHSLALEDDGTVVA